MKRVGAETSVPWVCPRSGESLEFVVNGHGEVRGQVLCPGCGHDHSAAVSAAAAEFGFRGGVIGLRKRAPSNSSISAGAD